MECERVCGSKEGPPGLPWSLNGSPGEGRKSPEGGDGLSLGSMNDGGRSFETGTSDHTRTLS